MVEELKVERLRVEELKGGGYLFPFEKLEVWQLAKKLSIAIYGISKEFPSNELYGLTSQINRAAISVASNLAEGSSRTSQKDPAYFSQLAYSSLMEVACQLSIAQELGFVDNEEYAEIRQQIEVLSRKINALHRSQKERATKVEKLKGLKVENKG
jgi:four helix bundle protein